MEKEECAAVRLFGHWPCGLMDKALVFGTKDCRFESCQGHEFHKEDGVPGLHKGTADKGPSPLLVLAAISASAMRRKWMSGSPLQSSCDQEAED